MSHAQTHRALEDTETLPKFPNWVRQVLGFGSMIVVLSGAFYSIKSDVRDISTRTEQRGARLDALENRTDKMGQDLSDIKGDVRYMRQMIENSSGRPR